MKLLRKLRALLERQNYIYLSDQELAKNVIPARYADNEQAMRIIKDTVHDMGLEIEQSSAGKRSTAVIDNPNNGQGMFLAVNTSTKSTFPPFLHDAGFRDKKSFLRAVKQGKGKTYNRVALRAIQRLERGTDPRNQHNQEGPDQEFLNFVTDPLPF